MSDNRSQQGDAQQPTSMASTRELQTQLNLSRFGGESRPSAADMMRYRSAAALNIAQPRD